MVAQARAKPPVLDAAPSPILISDIMNLEKEQIKPDNPHASTTPGQAPVHDKGPPHGSNPLGNRNGNTLLQLTTVSLRIANSSEQRSKEELIQQWVDNIHDCQSAVQNEATGTEVEGAERQESPIPSASQCGLLKMGPSFEFCPPIFSSPKGNSGPCPKVGRFKQIVFPSCAPPTAQLFTTQIQADPEPLSTGAKRGIARKGAKRRSISRKRAGRISAAELKLQHKLMKPCRCSRYKCSQKFVKEVRDEIHSNFWNNSFLGRRTFFEQHVRITETKHRKWNERLKRGIYNRRFSLAYHLPDKDSKKVRVCKRMFMSTLGMRTDGMITSYITRRTANPDEVCVDSRGRKRPRRKVVSQTIGALQQVSSKTEPL